MQRRGSTILYFVVTALHVTIWHVDNVRCCIGGRYGRYENWPSTNDWEELLLLLTGKYGSGGWGWQGTDSYAYKSVGDYPFGLGSSGGDGSSGYFSSPPSSGSPSSLYSSSNSHLGYSSGSTSGAQINTSKMKKALNDYFNSHKSHHEVTSNGGGGGGGYNFIDSPRPPPPTYSHYRDESPTLPAGPPYGPAPGLSGWSSGSSAPPGPPPDWPPPEPLPPSSPSHPELDPPHYGGDSYQGPSPTLGYNDNSNYNSDNTNKHRNIFPTDHEVFGTKKRRRHGRRRLPPPDYVSIGGQAGLPVKPERPHKSRKRYPWRRRAGRKQRLQDRRDKRIARRKFKTSFGGYKLDLSRFKFW